MQVSIYFVRDWRLNRWAGFASDSALLFFVNQKRVGFATECGMLFFVNQKKNNYWSLITVENAVIFIICKIFKCVFPKMIVQTHKFCSCNFTDMESQIIDRRN